VHREGFVCTSEEAHTERVEFETVGGATAAKKETGRLAKLEARIQAETDRVAEDHKQQMEARKQAERERLQRVAEAAESARQEALKPDKEKLVDYMDRLVSTWEPGLKSPEAIAAMENFQQYFHGVLNEFKFDIENL